MDARIGKYSIVRRIAVGGTAESYLAIHDELGGVAREVVIKCFLPHLAKNPDFIATFLDEARNIANLAHPNIVSVHEFGLEEQSCYLVMEHVEGVSLNEVLDRAGGLKPSFALRIASEVSAGLHYAHTLDDEEGGHLEIVHSDVSPHSVLLGVDGSVKVFDFGVAKAVATSQQMHPGSYEGGCSYISPEQAMGRQVDPRTDVHAVGVLLWEMLVGRHLFKRPSLYQTIDAVINEQPPSVLGGLPELSAEIDAIIAKATAKDPDARFQTCGDLQLAIDGYVGRNGLHSTALALGRYVERTFVPEAEFSSEESVTSAADEDALVDFDDFHDVKTVADDAEILGAISARSTLRVKMTGHVDSSGEDNGGRPDRAVTLSLRGRPTPTPIPMPARPTPTPVPVHPPPQTYRVFSDDDLDDSVTKRHPSQPAPGPAEEPEDSVTARHPSESPEPDEPDGMQVPPTAVVMMPGPGLDPLPKTSVTNLAVTGDGDLRQDPSGEIATSEAGGGASGDKVIVESTAPARPESTLPFATSSSQYTVEGRYTIHARRRRITMIVVLALLAATAGVVAVLAVRGDIDIDGIVGAISELLGR